MVEGFPRSGNTFTVFALQDAANQRLRIASHVHHPSQVIRAVSRGVPTVLVVRDPVSALASYLSYGQHGRPHTVLKEYVSYHRELIPYIDQTMVCTFPEIVSDLSAIIDRINERFSLQIPPFDQSPENVDRVFEEIALQHRLVHKGKNPDFVAPRPMSARRAVTDQARAGLLDPRHKPLLEDAVKLFEYFATRSAQQKAVYEQIRDAAPR